MKLRAIAALLVAVQALTGCWSDFQILPAEIPQLGSGTVRTIDGGEKRIRDEYSVRLIPHDNAVFLRPDPVSADIAAFPEYDTQTEPARRFSRAPKLRGPIDVKLSGGYLFLTGPDDRVTVWGGSVRALEIEQLSPGKTAGVVIGSVLGGMAGAALIAVITNMVFIWSRPPATAH